MKDNNKTMTMVDFYGQKVILTQPCEKFNPLEFVCVNDTKTGFFLPYPMRELWFRTIYPDAVIKTRLVEAASQATIGDRYFATAMYEATISDEDGDLLSQAFSQRVTTTGNTDAAETIAVGRAMMRMGFRIYNLESIDESTADLSEVIKKFEAEKGTDPNTEGNPVTAEPAVEEELSPVARKTAEKRTRKSVKTSNQAAKVSDEAEKQPSEVTKATDELPAEAVKQPVEAAEPAEQPVEAAEPAEQPVEAAEPAEQPVKAAEPAEQPAKEATPAEQASEQTVEESPKGNNLSSILEKKIPAGLPGWSGHSLDEIVRHPKGETFLRWVLENPHAPKSMPGLYQDIKTVKEAIDAGILKV